MKLNRIILFVLLMVQIPLHSKINKIDFSQWSKEQKLILGGSLVLLGVAGSIIGVLAHKNRGHRKVVNNQFNKIQKYKDRLNLCKMIDEWKLAQPEDDYKKLLNRMDMYDLLTRDNIAFVFGKCKELKTSCDNKGNTLLLQLVLLRNERIHFHKYDSLDVAEYLVHEGAKNIDAQNEKGFTALMLAAQYNDTDMLEVLFQANPNTIIMNSKDNNRIALDYTTEPECQVLIAKHMSR